MTALPKIFAGLADANIEHPEFELRDPAGSDEDIVAWLGALPSEGTRFVVFAQDGTGSLFCLWLAPGHDDVDAAPVAYLGSEGEVGVLGKDPASFLEYVASGMTFNGYSGGFFDALESEEDEDSLAEERERRGRAAAFVERHAGVTQLRPPAQLREQAEAVYPGLEAWIEANNAHR